MLVSISLLVPTVASLQFLQQDPLDGHHDDGSNMLLLSHGTSIVLFVTLVVYLYFLASVFAEAQNQRTVTSKVIRNGAEAYPEPRFGLWASASVLVVAAVATASCGFCLIESVDGFLKATHISRTFVSIILIPLACNAAQYVNIPVMSREQQIVLAVKQVISSVLQMTLLLMPSLVLLGWLLKQPMVLNFNTLEATVFFLAILVVNSVTQSEKATYFEGVMLIGT